MTTNVNIIKRVRFAGSAMNMGLYEAYIVEVICDGRVYVSNKMSLRGARCLKKQLVDEIDVKHFLREE